MFRKNKEKEFQDFRLTAVHMVGTTAWECGKSYAATASKFTRPQGPYVTARNAIKVANRMTPKVAMVFLVSL